jgi:hypothetical protein
MLCVPMSEELERLRKKTHIGALKLCEEKSFLEKCHRMDLRRNHTQCSSIKPII